MSFAELETYLINKQYFQVGQILCDIFCKEPEFFYSRVIIEGKIPDPVRHNFKKEIIHSLEKSIPEAMEIFKNRGIDSTILKTECNNLLKIIFSIRKNFENNVSLLSKCQFFKLPSGAQIQTILAHIESLHFQQEDQLEKQQHEKGILTGFEREVASLSGPDGKKSFSTTDIQEILVEYADDLLRYIFHLVKKSKIHEGFINNVNPKEVPGYFEALKLAQGNRLLSSAWDKVKYRNWHMHSYNVKEGNILSFEPLNVEAFKMERVSTIRYSYKNFAELPKLHARFGDVLDEAKEYIDDLGTSIKEVKDLFNLKKNSLKKARRLISLTFGVAIDELMETLPFPFMKQRIGNDRNVRISHLVEAVIYLSALSLIYEAYIQKKLEDKGYVHYEELAPIIDLETIYEHFGYIYSISSTEAARCIQLLIFDPDPDSGLDIFSQPLVSVGDSNVVLCPYLFATFNISRLVNQVLSKWNINLTQKGDNFEKQIRSNLSKNHAQLIVAPNSLKLHGVQYDGLAILKDSMVVMEMKCLKRPYDQNEYYYVWEEILHAVEQLETRAENLKANIQTLHRQWPQSKIIKSLTDEKIIKIVVLNILNFTGVNIGNVYITDYSSLEKFFLHPVVEEYRGDKLQKIHHLWEKSPSVEEFIKYLDRPIQIKHLSENLEPIFHPIILTSKDDNKIQLYDLILKNNLPIELI